jgi:predicted nuclease of predicted toxin-antitoxin system
MKLFIDENVSRLVVDRLRLDGHDLTLAQDVAFGRPDRELLVLALQLGAIILTEDTDFGELVMREQRPSAGVVLLRLSGLARSLQPDYIAQTLTTHAAALPSAFTVVTPANVRIRPLSSA